VRENIILSTSGARERDMMWPDGVTSARAYSVPASLPAAVQSSRQPLAGYTRALVLHHDLVSREVILHQRLHAFSQHWGFRVQACAPYRARTTDEVEQPLSTRIVLFFCRPRVTT